MNKTVTINLGGIVFNIDEAAYIILSEYLDKLKRALANTDGSSEIIKDVEYRFAEIFAEKTQNDTRRVIVETDVNSIIDTLGKPEDFLDNEQEEKNQRNQNHSNSYAERKLYRDGEDKIISGVAAGLGAYFRIDPLWVRLFFVALVWFAGTGIFAYILLWVITPEAITAGDRLKMQGAPVTLDNIKKKIDESADNVNNFYKSNRTSFEKLGDGLVSVIKIIGKAILLLIGTIVFLSIVGLIIAFFTALFGGIEDGPQFIHPEQIFDYFFPYTGTSLITTALSILLLIIPLVSIGLMIYKLLKRNHTIPKGIGITLFFTWLAVLIFGGVIALSTFNQFKADNSVTETISLDQITDSLYISFDENITNSDTESAFGHRVLISDLEGNYSGQENNILHGANNIDIKLRNSDTESFYIKIVKKAKGNNASNAKKSAENISQLYSVKNNKLVFNHFYSSPISDRFRFQEVDIYVYVPKGKHILLNDTTNRIVSRYQFGEHYDRDDLINTWLTIGDREIENSNIDVEDTDIDEINITINGEEIDLSDEFEDLDEALQIIGEKFEDVQLESTDDKNSKEIKIKIEYPEKEDEAKTIMDPI